MPSILRPKSKRHYHVYKWPKANNNKDLRAAAAKRPPTEAQVAELIRLGAKRLPKTCLAAADRLKRMKRKLGLL